MPSTLDPALTDALKLLNRSPGLRHRIPAPPDRTVVYSGAIGSAKDLLAAWRAIAAAKAQDPQRFDVETLAERLSGIHVPELGRSLLDHANRVTADLEARGLKRDGVILWRALSGIYVHGARGRVRALVMPGPGIAESVFALTEVKVLTRVDVLQQIEIDASLLRDFRVQVQAGLQPTPIVVF
jgi:hypothetical protein